MNTFLDSGIFITAWRRNELASVALGILTDDTCQFFTSQLVMLETLPKARFEKQLKVISLYSLTA